MRPDAEQPGSPAVWLRYARADLALARVALPPGGLYETLCFHAQQAAEKALKALLLARGVPFPRTRNLTILLDLVPPEIAAPVDVADAAGLTDYAVVTRYPTLSAPVTADEYAEAMRLAEAVVAWVAGRI